MSIEIKTAALVSWHRISTRRLYALLCRSGVRLTREIAQQPTLLGMTKSELHPGAAKQSDSDIDAFIRDTVHSGKHPLWACADMSLAQAHVRRLSARECIDSHQIVMSP